jgi:flavin reductase
MKLKNEMKQLSHELVLGEAKRLAAATHSMPADFRDGIARLGRAVNIVTTDGPAGPAGFSASSVCSVSDRPPTLLVCFDTTVSFHNSFVQNSAVCVNTLRPVHESLVRVFGGEAPMRERFAYATWKRRKSGAPVLEGAAVSFDCRVVSTSEVGNHLVLFCEVIGIERHKTASGLIYFDRGYHRICGVRSTNGSSDNLRWTDKDIERLRELANQNIHKIDIASVLGRTSHSVETQARKHGIKLKRVSRSHYRSIAAVT